MGGVIRLGLCGVVGAAAALGVFAISAPTATQAVLLQTLSPQVTLSRDGVPEYVTAELVIRSGDTVRTDVSGRAVVTYPDGSTATLDSSSELTIEFVRTSAGDYLVRMEQTVGRVWYAAARTIGSGGRYEVHSTAMASVIRAGSGFYVVVDEDGTTSLTATSGTLDATMGGATITLPVGTTVSAPGQTTASQEPDGAPQGSLVTAQAPALAVIAPAEAQPQTSDAAAAPDPVQPERAEPQVAPTPVAIPAAPTSAVTSQPAEKATAKTAPVETSTTVEKSATAEKATPVEKAATIEKAATGGTESASKDPSSKVRSTETTRSAEVASVVRSSEGAGGESRVASREPTTSEHGAQSQGHEKA